jgi:hypothetical protein
MPSTSGQPLNPRVPLPLETAPSGTAPDSGPVTRPGGFHESSYELKNGLEVSESSWPDEEETTIPGRLGER